MVVVEEVDHPENWIRYRWVVSQRVYETTITKFFFRFMTDSGNRCD